MAKHKSILSAVSGQDDHGLKFSKKWLSRQARALETVIKKPANLIKKQAILSAKRSFKFAKNDFVDTVRRIKRDETVDKVSRFIDSVKS